MTGNRIQLFDTTLRDGEQSPGCSMTPHEKVRMARALEGLGLDVIEAGFAIASKGDETAIRNVSREVRGPCITSMARACSQDIEAAARALEPANRARIHIVLASSDLHLQHKLRISRSEALGRAVAAVRLARTYVDEVEFSPEDATRSDRQFLCEMVSAVIDAGATVINLPDTVGYSLPAEYAFLFSMVREHVPQGSSVLLSAHCHNDLGLAVANTLAALGAGAQQVECTVNGIGERAGNAALEEVIAALAVRKDEFPFRHGLITERMFSASRLLSEIIGFGPQPNKAVVGRNAFAHEAGIHQHGVLSNPLTYEIMRPEDFGVPQNRIVLGKHSGRRALAHCLLTLGVLLEGEELDAVYRAYMKLADRKKTLYDLDLLSLVHCHRMKHPGNDPQCVAADLG